MGSGGLWVYPEQLSGTLGSEPDAMEACQMASFIMWALSGRKYSKTRTVTEVYECACRRPLYRATWPAGFAYPILDGGQIANVLIDADNCGCGHHGGGAARYRLRGKPIRKVHDVKIGGATAAPSTYRVANSGWLEVDGASPNGICGLEVTYTYGVGIPVAGRAAARMLAQEFLKSWSGDDDCALPNRTTNVSREGISFTIMDKQEFLDDLRTGVYEVDLFLRAVNPDKARKRARVFSPDLPKAWRTTASDPYITPEVYQLTTNYPLAVTQGSMLVREFTRYVNGQATNLSGYEWASQIRQAEMDTAPLVLDLAPYMQLDPVDPTTLVLQVPATVTGDMETLSSQASWDLFIWPLGDPDSAELWLQGRVTLDPATSAVPVGP